MLKELFDRIFERGQENAAGRQIHETPRDITYLLPGSEPRIFLKSPPPEFSTAGNLNAIFYRIGPDSLVWHFGDEIRAIHDARDPFNPNETLLELTPTAAWTHTSRAGQPRTQREFVHFIQQFYRPHFPDALLTSLRALNFRKSSETTGELQTGRESMGRQIRQELTGADDFPDAVPMLIPRWAEFPEILVSITCLLVIDLEKETIALPAQPDSIAAAQLAAHNQLSKILNTELAGGEKPFCPILFGKPNRE